MKKKYYDGFAIRDALVDFMVKVGNIQGADVVEVVRCKDCKMWGRTLTEKERQFCIDTNTDLVCEVWMSDGLMPNDFCSYGKRKEGEG